MIFADSAICYRNESSIGDYFSSTKFKSLGIEREELFITTKIRTNI